MRTSQKKTVKKATKKKRDKTTQNVWFDLDKKLHRDLSEWCEQHHRMPARMFYEAMINLLLSLPSPIAELLVTLPTDSPVYGSAIGHVAAAYKAAIDEITVGSQRAGGRSGQHSS
jgi:hypothetical protein